MPTPRSRMLAHDREQPFGLGRAERRGRLVHHEDARGVGQRLGDRDKLPLADAQFADAAGATSISTPADARRAARLAFHLAHCRGAARPHQFAAKKEVGRDVEARHEVEFLEDRGDAARLRVARAGEMRRRAIDEDFAVVRRDDAGQHVHQRRLAGAVFAEQRMNFALPADRNRRRAARARRQSACRCRSWRGPGALMGRPAESR